MIGDADPDRYAKAFELLQEDEKIDAIIVVVTPQNMTRPLELAEKLAAASRMGGQKPVLASFMGGTEVAAAKEKLMAVGIPNYPSPDRAVTALRAMCDYAAWKRRPPRVVTRFPVNRRRVDRIINLQARSGAAQVGEVEAKEILRAYDFNILGGQLARTGDEAVEIAERLGYPVVMKISSPDIIHKSDFGGVRINLANAEQVRDAFDLMMLRIQKRAPNAHLRGAYVEKMGQRGREVILGMTRDPQFGPMLMFGLGGIFVEVMKDVTFHLAPITAEEAMQMLKGTRSYALLAGRARPGAGGFGRHRRRSATHQPARHGLSGNHGAGHQPIHRRAGRRASLRGRRPHDAGKHCQFSTEQFLITDMNNQHPTFNTEHPMLSVWPARWMLGVRCSMFDVSKSVY